MRIVTNGLSCPSTVFLYIQQQQQHVLLLHDIPVLERASLSRGKPGLVLLKNKDSMNERSTAQPQKATITEFPSGKASLLQCKCACGQHTIAGGECEECRHQHEGTIQRAAVSAAPVNTVPPIVPDVLNSSGQQLDARTQAFMEPSFGYDFSQVRVHMDARAAESARAVNALAYTVGKNVVFGE